MIEILVEALIVTLHPNEKNAMITANNNILRVKFHLQCLCLVYVINILSDIEFD